MTNALVLQELCNTTHFADIELNISRCVAMGFDNINDRLLKASFFTFTFFYSFSFGSRSELYTW